jgi:hypothetical protein
MDLFVTKSGIEAAQRRLTVHGLLWHHRERHDDAKLDRGLGLRTGRHRAQAVRPGSYSLLNLIDAQKQSASLAGEIAISTTSIDISC